MQRLRPIHIFALLLALPSVAGAQQAQPNPAPPKAAATQQLHAPGAPRPAKPPALIDPAGPAVSLESSEALFDIGVALNSCGYDGGLDRSDPLRAKVRSAVEHELAANPAAQSARQAICAFIDSHRLSEARRDLAQYISLALYLTPPPELGLSVDQQDLPPDSTQVMDIVPLLKTFAEAAQLHVLWVEMRPGYDQMIARLHDPLTRMIMDTNIYLKMPAATYSGSRFLVVVEPLLPPAETNARIYGTDYVVVSSPGANGEIRMGDVRHTYLHYMIEPLLYSKASSMDRIEPILKYVREAPLDPVYKADIVSLVIECMIRAIEARTEQTGITVPKPPPNATRAQLTAFNQEHDEVIRQDMAARLRTVATDMAEGYVLTQYFFTQLKQFEDGPESLKEAIGPMVYAMDVDQQIHRARDTHFLEAADNDVVREPSSRTLDQAEARIKAGDPEGAQQLAMRALKDHTLDPARADYLLALSWLMKGDPQSAVNDLNESVRLAKDPHLLAWSHIYLGRIHDVEGERDEALSEYKLALNTGDGQPDTRGAAQKGLATPYALPHHQQTAEDASPQ